MCSQPWYEKFKDASVRKSMLRDSLIKKYKILGDEEVNKLNVFVNNFNRDKFNAGKKTYELNRLTVCKLVLLTVGFKILFKPTLIPTRLPNRLPTRLPTRFPTHRLLSPSNPPPHRYRFKSPRPRPFPPRSTCRSTSISKFATPLSVSSCTSHYFLCKWQKQK